MPRSPTRATGPADAALRAAALGVPVVPDVWMMMRACPRSSVTGNSGDDPAMASSSSYGWPTGIISAEPAACFT